MAIFRGTGGAGSANDDVTVTTVTTKASEAAASASAASSSASSASTSATSATNSASTATTKASEASTSKDTATTKASEASTSATAAANSATAAAASAATVAQDIGTSDSPTFAGLTINGAIVASSTVDGRDLQTDGSKLDSIEASATADQSNAEIRTAVEAASDSNVFTDADHSKLNAIEASATADQTNAEIRAAVEAATDSNVFTDADHTKLNGIEASATADQSNDEIKAAVEAASDSNTFTDADHTKLNNIESSATADQTNSEIKTAVEAATSIALGGSPTTTTQAESDDSTKIATTAYVVDKITTLIGGAPSTLNDLNELAAAINDDNNYNSTLTTALATKLPLAGGAMTGPITLATGGASNTDKAFAVTTSGTNFESDGGIINITHAGSGSNTGGYFQKFSTGGVLRYSIKGNGDIHTTGTVDGRDLQTDGSKLDGIAASANNYVHPNHSGEVTSTADGATVIADNIVDEANLKVSNAPTNGYALTAQSGDAGGMTWASLVGKQTMWIPAAAMYPSTTNPCSDLEQVETTALRPDLKVLDFATGADEFAQFSIAFPKSWNEGTLTFQPFWTVTGTNTGTVAWQLGGIAVSSDDTINTAFGTLVATTALAHSGTSNDLMMSAESGAVTIAGSPAANDVCFFQVNRDVSADTQSGDARLLGIKLFFTNDALTDA